MKKTKKTLNLRFLSAFLSLVILLGTGALPISAVTRSSMDRSSIVDGENDGFELPIELPIEVSDGPTILTSDDEEIAEDSKILNYVDADEFDSAKHVRRLHALEQLNTYVFQNFDGSRSVYMMDENVKYVDENGDVREKDISLKSILGGFGITESDIELLIPLMPTSGIELGHLGYNLKLIPQNVMSTLASQIGNSVVYNSVYGSDTKLKYTPLLSGIKEDIILNEYTENASYSFVLETDGLALFENQNGRYLAVNENSDPLFYIGNVIVYDAVGKPDIGEMTVETLTQGARYLLTVSAHDEFLSDPDTVYPVTVDPSITISDSSISGSIIDAPVFQNYPDRNCGNYVYNTVGTTSSSYGIGRTAVKLPGLLSNNDYLTITSSQIKSVKFYAKEGSGGGSQYINLYPLTSNTAWNESDVTWNSDGSYTTTLDCGASSSGGAWSTFDITALVKGWKDNKYPANAGFILINSTESNKRCFLSSEYSTSSDRPYVVFEYEPLIYIGPSTISAYEGSTLTLSATTRPSGQSVTWSSSNTSIATVSQSGNFTAVKAGHCEITATFYDSDGVLHTGYADVTVLVPSGVYYITNLNSGYYLNVRACRIAEGSIVNQSPTYAASAPAEASLSEMWKINRVQGDKYSIRPMSKLDMGLHVTGTNVDIYGIGTTDSISAISESALWTIEWQSTGYVFKKNGGASGTLQIRNASTIAGDPAAANNYVDNANCRWTLSKIASPPSGVYLYDTERNKIGVSVARYVAPKESRTLSEQSVAVISYDVSNISQSFSWTSANGSFVSVNNSGTISGKAPGTATITAQTVLSGTTYSVSYTVITTPIANGTYYIQNKQTGYCADIESNAMVSGTTINQWEYTGGDSQRWIFEHLGDGYYSIKSNNSSSAYYMGVIDDSTALDVDVVLRTGTITNGMKWKVEGTANGAYKIIPRSGASSGYVLATTTSNALNGYKLIQGDYIDNDSYRDEWLIIESYSVVLYGITNSGHDHISCLNEFADTMRSSTWYDVTVRGGAVLPSTCKNDLLSTNLFISRSHGVAHYYNFDGALVVKYTGIILDDNGSNNVGFFSHSFIGISSESTIIQDNDDYTGLTLALFIGCETAKGGAGARNLPSTIVEHGATAAVGFSETITCEAANKWTEDFYKKMLEGATLKEAVRDACNNAKEGTGMKSAVICGDSSIRLPIN